MASGLGDPPPAQARRTPADDARGAGMSAACRRALLRAVVLIAAGTLAGCAAGPPSRALPGGYCVNGHGCYRVLASAAGYHASGVASWYGLHAAGRATASGVPFNPYAMRIANKVLPFGTWVRIRNLRNGRVAVAMVDDRGPFYGGRIVDATPAVAHELGYYRRGTAPVRVRVIPRAELTGAQQQAARTDERIAVDYAKRHPHELLAEAGRFALRGVIDITSTGVRIAVGIVWYSLKLAVDILRHL